MGFPFNLSITLIVLLVIIVALFVKLLLSSFIQVILLEPFLTIWRCSVPLGILNLSWIKLRSILVNIGLGLRNLLLKLRSYLLYLAISDIILSHEVSNHILNLTLTLSGKIRQHIINIVLILLLLDVGHLKVIGGLWRMNKGLWWHKLLLLLLTIVIHVIWLTLDIEKLRRSSHTYCRSIHSLLLQ